MSAPKESGGLAAFTDAKGNVTSYTYDAKGNLLTTSIPNNSVETYWQLHRDRSAAELHQSS